MSVILNQRYRYIALLAACLCICASAAWADDQLVSYWPFNEAEGTIYLHDAMGRVNGLILDDGIQAEAGPSGMGPGLLDSGAGTTSRGYGSAITFEPNDRVTLGRPDTLQFARNDFTITGWFSISPVEGNEHRILLDNAQHRQGGYAVLVSRSEAGSRGKLVFDVKGPDDGNLSITSDDRVDDGRWHHFTAVVRDQTMELYVDGRRQQMTRPYAPTSTASAPDSKQAAIASNYTGALDDIAVFARALDDATIADIYENGLTAFGFSPEQLSPTTLVEPPDDGITITERTVFDGHTGWKHNGIIYRLAVGVIMAQAANGDLLLAWTTGSDKEPADDNCGVLSRSTDGGKTWTEPVELVPAKDGMQGVITNLYQTKDGRVVLYGAHLPPEDKYTTWYYFRMISDDHGKTWSSPEPFELRDAHGSLGQGEIPIELSDGRSLYVGHWYRKREQPLVAPAADLARAPTIEEAIAMPAGEGRAGGGFAEFWMGLQVYAAPNDHSTEFEPLGSVFDRPLGLIEPTTIRLNDGTLVVLMRADWGGYLWRTESHDDGKSWSDAYQTDIPNPSSMVDLVRLADGRIALIHNPSGGIVGQRASRDPLAIWISDDEMQTWSVKKNIITGGQLAYPDSIILDDGALVFGYDRDRRQVRFVEVEIDAE